MGGRAKIFELLAGEDIDGDQVDLGVAVLASLGGGHFNDFARTVLDDDEAVLPQSRALHRVGSGGTGIGALEGVLMLYTMRSAEGSMVGAQKVWRAACAHAGGGNGAARRGRNAHAREKKKAGGYLPVRRRPWWIMSVRCDGTRGRGDREDMRVGRGGRRWLFNSRREVCVWILKLGQEGLRNAKAAALA